MERCSPRASRAQALGLDHELAEERLLVPLELDAVVVLARREASQRDEGAAGHAGGREVPGAGAEEPR